MKINGKRPQRNRDIFVIPRGQDEDLVFFLEAVLSYDEFDSICPPPAPPVLQFPGDVKSRPDYADKAYIERTIEHSELRQAWTMIETLSPTENLEWETVDPLKPETWKNWEKEFQEAGISQAERMQLMLAVLSINGLDGERLEKAKDDFLASRLLGDSQQS